MKLVANTKSYDPQGKTSNSTTTTRVEGWKEALYMIAFIGTAFIQQCKGDNWTSILSDATYMSNQLKKMFGNE